MESELIDVVIIGAGIAGLTAGKILKSAGKTIKIIEASDGVGGRVRTDHINGFLLDRGFQVLLTAYPETQKILDYKRLNLKVFKPGAIVLTENNIDILADPFREPSLLLKTLFSPIGNFTDKFKMLALKLKLHGLSIDKIFSKPETETFNYLNEFGFTTKIIEQFFRPFFSGIFLESDLRTSSRMFEFLFKMFSEGDTAVPENGMGMISDQLAESIAKDEFILNERIVSIQGHTVIGASGKVYHGKKILIATDALHVPWEFRDKVNIKGKQCLTYYYKGAKSEKNNDRIILNSAKNHLTNNIAFMDRISSSYAPNNQSLIAVTLKPSEADVFNRNADIKKELKQWYPETENWELIKTYSIPYALPENRSVINDLNKSKIKLAENCFICGDHLLNGSINAAIKSGRLAAEAILNNLT
ncbi:NAD(P)/FAD-dependent oxidoreductase [Pedobacter fastidiosus]|uniref:FAD-dependent oxidoreductase n=1 Tax=Pedobacter fastidiosus TaxID=2765361 RepID=A0ABR7KXW1_9SPHI|nr:NAD(P)/FAD-dependent oxidoreductase [Pedobacter fastidiosus]MBC6112968.1 FAD-dependent oxidoreductase [Pedobacter fastidiosus]